MTFSLIGKNFEESSMKVRCLILITTIILLAPPDKMAWAQEEPESPQKKDMLKQDSEQADPVVSIQVPDTMVYDQTGKRLHFYTDLVKGKTVAINFNFTTSTTIGPPLTATFRRVQQLLGERGGRDIQLIFLTTDPTTDGPEKLQAYAAKFEAAPGWTFVTGDKDKIEILLRALGAAVTDKNDSTPMILIGNDAAGYWTRAYGLSSPSKLVEKIMDAAKRKPVPQRPEIRSRKSGVRGARGKKRN
jgi:protein SCO1